MRISDWISDVCSSDLSKLPLNEKNEPDSDSDTTPLKCWKMLASSLITDVPCCLTSSVALMNAWSTPCSSPLLPTATKPRPFSFRSEEHTSELQSLMRISYAVFCLKKKNTNLIKQ